MTAVSDNPIGLPSSGIYAAPPRLPRLYVASEWRFCLRGADGSRSPEAFGIGLHRRMPKQVWTEMAWRALRSAKRADRVTQCAPRRCPCIALCVSLAGRKPCPLQRRGVERRGQNCREAGERGFCRRERAAIGSNKTIRRITLSADRTRPTDDEKMNRIESLSSRAESLKTCKVFKKKIAPR